MDASSHPKVAVVFRGQRPADGFGRLAAVAEALTAAGLAPAPCPYDEAAEDACRAQLLASDAALVWVNPVQDGRDRHGLNRLLQAAADAGVRVSAHPEVIAKMGVKAVLWRTREMGWSGDAQIYETPEALRAGLAASLGSGPRVLKPNRGNGGQGVWKVERAGAAVKVMEATGEAVRTMPLEEFVAERIAEFGEGYVDQAFQARLGDGMIRCYMSGERLAGFGWQKVRALMPPGTPGEPRTYSGPGDPRFQALKAKMEREWTPALRRILDIAPGELPAIWDADFMFGPKDAAGRDSFVLCEINVSSVHPMPDEAPAEIARTLAQRLAADRRAAEPALP